MLWIAPYFQHELAVQFREAPYYSVSFDESFNSVIKEEQMDIFLRFQNRREIVTRYYTTNFLGHTRADDLKKTLTGSLKDLDPNKMVHIGMDGPSTNFKVLKELIEERNIQDANIPKVLETGSCSLHIVHGALSTGLRKTGWNLDILLKALFKLFNKAPAQREEYTTITKSKVFPKHFCATRWVEDKDVAERAVEVWPNIIKYVKHIDKKTKSQQPTSPHYKTVADAVHNDALVVAKFELLITIANDVKCFLTLFQTETPMMPFLPVHLEKVIRDLMVRVVKPDKLKEATSGTKLVHLDVAKADNLLLPRKVDIGFSAKSFIAKIPEAIVTS